MIDFLELNVLEQEYDLNFSFSFISQSSRSFPFRPVFRDFRRAIKTGMLRFLAYLFYEWYRK